MYFLLCFKGSLWDVKVLRYWFYFIVFLGVFYIYILFFKVKDCKYKNKLLFDINIVLFRKVICVWFICW